MVESKTIVELKKIKDIFNKKFFIPEYQRGYRWDEWQVKDLLDDFYEFFNKENKTDEEFYCLQPLVLKHNKEKDYKGKDYYEVIDGQQRLTTIYILLHYLEIENKFTIEYARRKGALDIKNILENKDKNIDFKYISEAYESIEKWFNNDENKKSNIKKLLLAEENNISVKFIWYELEDDNINPIDIFVRINIGKIRLTNCELIKALFLQQMNFGEENEYYKERQIEIANEWDFIENTLQDDSFWGFINNDFEKKSNRIDYIFDLMLEDVKNKDIDIGKDDYRAFRYLYNEWKKNETDKTNFIENKWEEIRNYFYAMNKWYNDLKQYHYIGYIIYFGNKEKTISEIYKLYKDNPLKSDFEKKLKEKIKDIVKSNKDEIEELIFSTNNRDKIRRILLLYNIEYMLKNKNLKSKFPFDIFKKEKWDIEHIEPQTPNSDSDKDSQKNWLKMMLDCYIPKSSEKESDSNSIANINKFIDKNNEEITSDEFDKLREAINEIIKDKDILDDEDKDYKDHIGNLVLLDSGTNRSYKNKYFIQKREKIIKKDKAGEFIPICTKNAFLKYFDDSPSASTIHKWTKEDMEKYKEDIINTLSEFINKGQTNGNE